MLSVLLTQKKFWDNPVEGYIFFLKENLQPTTDLASIDLIEQEFYPHLKEILKKHLFEGKRGQCFILSGMRNNNLVQFIFIGLGKLDGKWHEELEVVRRAVATAAHQLKKLSIKNAVLALPNEKLFTISTAELIKQSTI